MTIKSFLKLSLFSSFAVVVSSLVACNDGSTAGKAGTSSGGDNVSNL